MEADENSGLQSSSESSQGPISEEAEIMNVLFGDSDSSGLVSWTQYYCNYNQRFPIIPLSKIIFIKNYKLLDGWFRQPKYLGNRNTRIH